MTPAPFDWVTREDIDNIPAIVVECPGRREVIVFHPYPDHVNVALTARRYEKRGWKVSTRLPGRVAA